MRLKWLGLQGAIQPYEQLAKYYKNQGREDDGNEVLIRKNEIFKSRSGFWSKLKYHILGKIAYGYNAWGLFSVEPIIIRDTVYFNEGR